MTDPHVFQFDAKVWRDRDNEGWHFITVPEDISEEIKFFAYCGKKPKRSLRVMATIGATIGATFGATIEDTTGTKISEVSWITSLFPDKTIECYLLPIKQNILTRANVDAGDRISAQLKF